MTADLIVPIIGGIIVIAGVVSIVKAKRKK